MNKKKNYILYYYCNISNRLIHWRFLCSPDTLFAQVMKIHQNISELVNDRLTDDVIDEYANDVAVELIKNVISSNPDKIGYDLRMISVVDTIMITICICYDLKQPWRRMHRTRATRLFGALCKHEINDRQFFSLFLKSKHTLLLLRLLSKNMQTSIRIRS